MALPDFNEAGDLPAGVHQAHTSEVVQRFGVGTPQHALVTHRLLHVYDLAKRTGHLQRLIIFGSYVTTKTEPNDVDVVLVMDDGFSLRDWPIESIGLFDHAIAQARYGASVFWIRRGSLGPEEREEMEQLGDMAERLTLKKAYAYAMLRWRGFPLPTLEALESHAGPGPAGLRVGQSHPLAR